jgi:saccharopine dehydrogenase (NAD+, L-lysine-forming)
MALLGSGFDPGVTSVYTTYTKKHLLDRIDTLDILDCNGGDTGLPFATNFNPEINLREVTAPSRHWENGQWIEGPALSHKQVFDFDQVGPKRTCTSCTMRSWNPWSSSTRRSTASVSG